MIVFFLNVVTMKIKNLFMMLLALMLVATACEKSTDTPQTPDNTEEPETPNEDENKDDDGIK